MVFFFVPSNSEFSETSKKQKQSILCDFFDKLSCLKQIMILIVPNISAQRFLYFKTIFVHEVEIVTILREI